MAFVLPSFSAASNYAASFQPVQPLIMPDNVKSTAFAEALKEANQLEYAAAAQLGKAAGDERGAIIRRQLAEEGALKRAELAREPKPVSKADKLVALAQLGKGFAPGGGAKGGPMQDLLGITQAQKSLSTNRHQRLAGSAAIKERLIKELPLPAQSETGSTTDYTKLFPQTTTIEVEPATSMLEKKQNEQDLGLQVLSDALKNGDITQERASELLGTLQLNQGI